MYPLRDRMYPGYEACFRARNCMQVEKSAGWIFIFAVPALYSECVATLDCFCLIASELYRVHPVVQIVQSVPAAHHQL